MKMIDVPRKVKNWVAFATLGVLGLKALPLISSAIPSFFSEPTALWILGVGVMYTIYNIWHREIGGIIFGVITKWDS